MLAASRFQIADSRLQIADLRAPRGKAHDSSGYMVFNYVPVKARVNPTSIGSRILPVLAGVKQRHCAGRQIGCQSAVWPKPRAGLQALP
jgi:hypothetical protein